MTPSGLIGRRVQVFVASGRDGGLPYELHPDVGEIVDAGCGGSYGGSWSLLVLWPNGTLRAYSPSDVRVIGDDGAPYR